MAKEKRSKFNMECKECGRRNYASQKSLINQKEKVALSKFCRFCKKHTLHKEVK